MLDGVKREASAKEAHLRELLDDSNRELASVRDALTATQLGTTLSAKSNSTKSTIITVFLSVRSLRETSGWTGTHNSGLRGRSEEI